MAIPRRIRGTLAGRLLRAAGLAALAALLLPAPVRAAEAWLMPPFTLTTPLAATAREPAVAMNADGILAVAWVEDSKVWAMVRSPGQPFPAPEQLSLAGGVAPAVAIHTDGAVLVAWVRGTNLETAFRPAGQTSFDPTGSVLASGRSPTNGPVAAFRSDGTAVLAWPTIDLGTGTARVEASRRPPGGTFASPLTLDMLTPGVDEHISLTDVSMALSPGQTAVVAWRRDVDDSADDERRTAIRAARISAANTVTGPVDLATALDDSAAPDQVVAGARVGKNVDGEFVYAWTRQVFPFTGSTTQRVEGCSGPNATPGCTAAPEPLSGDGTSASNIRFAGTPDGNVYGVWNRAVAGTTRVELARRPAHAVGFTASQLLSESGIDSTQPEIAGDGRGKTVVIWRQTEGDQRVRGRVGDFSGFDPVLDVSEAVGTPADLSLTASGGGDAAAAWTQSGMGPGATIARLAAFDVTPPQLGATSIPAAGQAGSPVAFSASATDFWGPVSLGWDFGDGGAAAGGEVSHSYGAAGAFPVAVTATDAAGNSASASGTTAIAPAPDTVAPSIVRLRMRRSRFAVGRRPTPLTAGRRRRTPRGSALLFELSEQASVTIRIARRVRGVRVRGRCRFVRRPRPDARRCTLFRRVGSLRRSGSQGANRVAFSGRLGKRALRPGRYRATLTATDAAANRSAGRAVGFRIVRR